MESKEAIILFDGFCRLCNGTVRFLAKRDAKNVFKFVSLQSEKGKQFTIENNLEKIDSVILIYGDSVYFQSDAFIEIVRILPSPWNLLRIIKHFPKKWRDYIYDVIVYNRFRWFGRQKSCVIE